MRDNTLMVSAERTVCPILEWASLPLSRGGTNTVDNVQPLCKGCNMRKATKTIDYRPQIADVG